MRPARRAVPLAERLAVPPAAVAAAVTAAALATASSLVERLTQSRLDARAASLPLKSDELQSKAV